jgi:hypothetical protein
MRPKIVILILVVAVGLVAVAALLKATVGRPSTETQANAPAEAVQETSAVAVATIPGSTNAAAITEQLRAAELGKELDQIRSIVVEGVGSPTTLGILVGKVTHAEPAVRSAALQAVVSLNDTNAIPGLEKAAEAMEDPREKVAVMDAIAYLKLPDGLPDTPLTNAMIVSSTSAPPWAVKWPPNSHQKKALRSRAQRRLQNAQAQGQQGAPPVPAQSQPMAPDPASAPPQTDPAAAPPQ